MEFGGFFIRVGCYGHDGAVSLVLLLPCSLSFCKQYLRRVNDFYNYLLVQPVIDSLFGQLIEYCSTDLNFLDLVTVYCLQLSSTVL